MRTSMAVCLFLLTFAVGTSGQTVGGMFHQDVSWAPDGKHLAFCGMHDFDPQTHAFKADMYVVGVDGSGLARISGEERTIFIRPGEEEGSRLERRCPEPKIRTSIPPSRTDPI